MDYSLLKDIIAGILSIFAITSLWASFYKFGSTKVEIEIMEDLIILRTIKNTLSLAPCLYIATAKKKYRLLSVGEESLPMVPHIKVHLTNYHGEIGGSKEYYECVSAYFRNAFYKLINRRIFVLPKVTLIGSNKLHSQAKEVDQSLLYKAFMQAGAIECKFV